MIIAKTRQHKQNSAWLVRASSREIRPSWNNRSAVDREMTTGPADRQGTSERCDCDVLQATIASCGESRGAIRRVGAATARSRNCPAKRVRSKTSASSNPDVERRAAPPRRSAASIRRGAGAIGDASTLLPEVGVRGGVIRRSRVRGPALASRGVRSARSGARLGSPSGP